jgi:hypothetical protein
MSTNGAFYHGQEVIWNRQNPKNPPYTIPTPATYLEPRGAFSARIQIGYVTKTVRLDSLEPAKTRPSLVRSGVFI